MSKYIDAEKLAVLINDYLELPTMNTAYQAGIQKALQMLNAYPAADVQEVKHGKWVKKAGKPTCNQCGEVNYLEPNFCPNCGAKMDGGITNDTETSD